MDHRFGSDHHIHVRADGAAAGELAGELAVLPGVEAVPAMPSCRLGRDAQTVDLLIAGVSGVEALIAALAAVWVARLTASPVTPPGTVPQPRAGLDRRPVLYLHTDIDSIRVLLDANGHVTAVDGELPYGVDDVTEVRMATEPT
jgi:hypothetical protein